MQKRYIKTEKPALTASEKAAREEVVTLQTQLAEAQAALTAASSTVPSSDNATVAPSDEVVRSAVQEVTAKLESTHADALAAQERTLRAELASTVPASVAPAEPSREAIDEAVQAALSAKALELQTMHASALAKREQELKEEMRVAVEQASASVTQAHSSKIAPEEVEKTVQSAVAAKEAELKALHEAALQAAASSVVTPAASVDPEAHKAEIAQAVETAVAAALQRAHSEQASKSATQKNVLDRLRKDNINLKTELSQLKSTATPAASATVPAVAPVAVATPAAVSTPVAGRAGLPPNPVRPKPIGPASTVPGGSPSSTAFPGPATRARVAQGAGQTPPAGLAPGGIKGAAMAAGAAVPGMGRGGANVGRGAAIAGRGGAGAGARGGRGGARSNLFSGGECPFLVPQFSLSVFEKEVASSPLTLGLTLSISLFLFLL